MSLLSPGGLSRESDWQVAGGRYELRCRSVLFWGSVRFLRNRAGLSRRKNEQVTMKIKLNLSLALTACVIGLSACGWKAPCPPTTLTAPWDKMNLPVQQDAAVCVSSADKFQAAYKGRCLLVGFNLPFDLSRIAFDVAPARGRFSGRSPRWLRSSFPNSVRIRGRSTRQPCIRTACSDTSCARPVANGITVSSARLGSSRASSLRSSPLRGGDGEPGARIC